VRMLWLMLASALTVIAGGVAYALQVLGLFLASTIVFDAIHWLLHRFSGSGRLWLERLGELHEVHHRFLGRDLRIHDAYQTANIFHHVIPEYATHVAFSLALLQVLPTRIVFGTLVLQTFVVGFILFRRGKDPNHVGVERVPAYRPMFACVPPYHWLHHRYPDAHFSSYVKLFDHLMGTGVSLAGRRVGLSTVSTAFATTLGKLLERAGVAEVRPLEPDPSDGRMRDLDILVLTHEGSAEASRGVVERFGALVAERRFPAEVWALVREREFEPYARGYYTDPRLIYRHVTGSKTEAAAKRAFFLIRRGFNYVPTSWRGALDFPRFFWRVAVRDVLPSD